MTSTAQIPTAQSYRKGQAVTNVIYRLTMTNNYGRQCLDGDRNTIPSNGAKVQLWGCNGWDNQTWVWHGATLTNTYGGQCLDGDRNTIPSNGARVQLWGCNGWDNQNWTLH